METLINLLETNILQCPGKKLIGLNCLGCGFQRSFILLLKGNLIDSFLMYPALIPIIIMFVYLIVHFFLNFKKGAKTLQYFYLLNTILIIANYIIKF